MSILRLFLIALCLGDGAFVAFECRHEYKMAKYFGGKSNAHMIEKAKENRIRLIIDYIILACAVLVLVASMLVSESSAVFLVVVLTSLNEWDDVIINMVVYHHLKKNRKAVKNGF